MYSQKHQINELRGICDERHKSTVQKQQRHVDQPKLGGQKFDVPNRERLLLFFDVIGLSGLSDAVRVHGDGDAGGDHTDDTQRHRHPQRRAQT